MKPILLQTPLFLKDILEVTKGTLPFSTAAPEFFLKIATDTREDLSDSLFIALKGENFDGHSFLPLLKEKGASCALVESLEHCPPDFPVVLVKDTKEALGDLARFKREKWGREVFALTGSNGKTTTKEMLFAIFKKAWGEEKVAATQGNLNNDLGVPFTLLPLGKEKVVVVEMGMNHPGEIAYLSKIAAPNRVLITNAGRAHLSGLKSVENVAKEKGAICQGLKENGVALFPKNSPYFPLWEKEAQNKKKLSFAVENLSADFCAQVKEKNGEWILCLKEGEIPLKVLGKHNAENALAAFALATSAGVDFPTIKEALSAFEAPKGRLHARFFPKKNWKIIDDSYNANPESMEAAIGVLSTLTGKKILVLGDMGEIGEEAEALHRAVGKFAKEKGIDALYAMGEKMRRAVEAFGENAVHFEKIEDFIALIQKETLPTTFLVKGSRFMQMEKVVQTLEALCS